MNLIRCGSSDIYSKEYKWTRLETKKTTISIVAERESNIKSHSIFKTSNDIQVKGSKTKHDEEFKVTSKKTKSETKKLKKITKIEIIDEPKIPINRPKPNKTRDEKRGKKIKSKYIFL